MFKVMTWNLENLFLVGAASGPKTKNVYDAELAGLAAIINAQAPDALAVQEVGDPAALDDLEALLSGTWRRRVSDHPDHRQIRVAWLCKPDITASENIVAFPAPLMPVQSDDTGATGDAMGRAPSRSRSSPPLASRCNLSPHT
jgi:hypothetical protein